MEKPDQTRSLSRQTPSTQLNKPSPRYAEWITLELGKIAILLGAEVSKERLSLMVVELSSLEPNRLRWALKQARKRCRFFPTPAEIYGFVGEGEEKISHRLLVVPHQGPINLQDQIDAVAKAKEAAWEDLA